MARNQLNLNRYRKIYPQLRKSPVLWIKDTSIQEVKVLDANVSLSFTTTVTVNSPVVVASPEGTTSNVNVWVETIVADSSGNFWDITVAVSDTSYTGKVHVMVGDASP